MRVGEGFDERLTTRYLAVLGVGRRPPSVAALGELVAAHLTRIPFENISKLHRRKYTGVTGLPDIALFLDGIERHHFGGTCYANNFHLYSLLVKLGYAVTLCGADMAHPNVHMVCLVNIADREFLVDVGYGAPFFAPLPRDLAQNHVIEWGNDRYILRPQDTDGRSQLALYRDGIAKHGYVVNPAPRKIQEFERVILNSFRPEATFLNAVLATRFYADHSVVVHNLTMLRERPGESLSRTLHDRDEMAAMIEQEFGIPHEITTDAISEVQLTQDAWG